MPTSFFPRRIRAVQGREKGKYTGVDESLVQMLHGFPISKK